MSMAGTYACECKAILDILESLFKLAYVKTQPCGNATRVRAVHWKDIARQFVSYLPSCCKVSKQFSDPLEPINIPLLQDGARIPNDDAAHAKEGAHGVKALTSFTVQCVQDRA